MPVFGKNGGKPIGRFKIVEQNCPVNKDLKWLLWLNFRMRIPLKKWFPVVSSPFWARVDPEYLKN